eukprot:3671305-Pleurochrysis_carterae.AAC.1
MLAQLEERGLVKNLGEAVRSLVARANEVRLDRAVELTLAEIILPALIVLIAHEQHGGAAAEPGADGVEEMAEKAAEEGVPLSSNTTGC